MPFKVDPPSGGIPGQFTGRLLQNGAVVYESVSGFITDAAAFQGVLDLPYSTATRPGGGYTLEIHGKSVAVILWAQDLNVQGIPFTKDAAQP